MTKEEEQARAIAELSGVAFALTGLMVTLLGHMQQHGLGHIVQGALDDAEGATSATLGTLEPSQERLIAADVQRRLGDMRKVLIRELN